MNMETICLPFGQPLADDYIGRKREALEPLLGYHAADEEHWKTRLRRLRNHEGLRADSRSVAAAVKKYQEPFGLSEQVRSNLELLEQGSPVVVGGQQAVLWTGPLMIIHKAVTILQTAEWASRLLGETVVPVFWIAGEDHDWDEASQTFVPDAGGTGTRKLSTPRPGSGRSSVSRTQLDPGMLGEALAQLEAALPDSPHKLALCAELRHGSESCRTLTELFALMLNALFGEKGLLLVDADDPGLRSLEGPMFSELVSRNAQLEQAFLAGTASVEQLGYKPQADLAEGGANLFLFHQDGEAGAEERVLLHRRGDRFEDRKGLVSLSSRELASIAERQPERLSNNVFTRPLMQEFLFPVLSTVLGPGEIAYWAQTGAAFRELGMEMPILTPRLSFTLLEPAAAKTMEAYGISFEDALGGIEAKKKQWLAGSGHYGISERFQEALLRMRDAYSPALAMAASVEKGLADLGENNWSRIAREIQYMEDKTKKALESREQTALDRMDALGTAVCPEGRPQERVLASVYYLNVYGRRWLDVLLAAPFEPCAGHRLVRL